MAGKTKEYIKLPGRGFKRGSIISAVGIRARLWRGKDHILSVLNFGYFEEYRRFYYKDIQAFTIRKTARGAIWNLVFIFIAFFIATIALFSHPEISSFILAFSSLFILCLIINIFRGKTCITTVHTAVGHEELPSLGRLRKAVKVISLLEPFIEEAQGKLSSEEIGSLAQEISHQEKTVSPASAGGREERSNYGGKFHTLLFVLLLVDAFLSAIPFFYNNVFLTLISSLLFFALSALAIIALIKQHNSMLGKGIKGITWMVMGYMVIAYFSSYFFYLFDIAIKHPEAINNQWESLKIMSALSPYDNSYYFALLIGSTLLSSLLGLSGLALVRSSFRREAHVTEPPPLEVNDMI